MGLVKEKDHLRQLGIPALRQHFIKFTQHPQHKSGIERRAQEQLIGSQDIDHALAALILDKPIGNIKGRLTKELIAALVFKYSDGALDGADGCF